MKVQPITQRLMARREVTPSGCWHWTGHLDAHGYGRMKVNRLQKLVHREAYQAFVGPIPDGLPLDHVCHSNDLTCLGGDTCLHRRCMNPEHLEAVTTQVNLLRGRGFVARYAAQTHCLQGHEFNAENTLIDSLGRRGCRSCGRDRKRNQVVSDEERERRRLWWAAYRLHGPTKRRSDHGLKTHCPQGHDYDEANTRIEASGRRACRACDRVKAANKRQRKALAS